MKNQPLFKPLFIFLTVLSFTANAQFRSKSNEETGAPEKADQLDPNVYGNGLTMKINESGSKYLRLIMWNQFQLSGGTDSPGMKFGIRRSRVLLLSQFTPRFLLLTHFGLNSLSAATSSANPNASNSNASDFYLHGAWGEFAVKPGMLHLGAGLHYFNGFSRLSNQSTLNFMTMDNPGSGLADAKLFPWADITTNNQFARNLGIYAKGTVGKLSYRASANNARQNIQQLDSMVPSFQVGGTGKDWVYTAYVNVNLLDAESDKLPYFVGTYLGKKRILSIGAGFNTQPRALKTSQESLQEQGESVSRFAVDVFYDAPVGEKGAAINLLGALYSSKYGSNESFSNGGLVPGSGNILYGQAGFLLPSKSDHKLMPYLTYSSQDLKNTPNKSNELGIGANWFIAGHNAKVTFEHNSGIKGTTDAQRKKMTRMQLHVFI